MQYKLFTYGTLLLESYFKNFLKYGDEEKVISIEPAFIEGKMYNVNNRFPAVIKADEGKRSRIPLTVFGGIITFEANPSIWTSIDNYEGCSLGNTNFNNKYDLYHREQTMATPIEMSSMLDFLSFKFTTHKPVSTWVYYFNVNNPNADKYIQQDRGGQVWKTFFEMEFWDEYKNNQGGMLNELE